MNNNFIENMLIWFLGFFVALLVFLYGYRRGRKSTIGRALLKSIDISRLSKDEKEDVEARKNDDTDELIFIFEVNEMDFVIDYSKPILLPFNKIYLTYYTSEESFLITSPNGFSEDLLLHEILKVLDKLNLNTEFDILEELYAFKTMEGQVYIDLEMLS